LLALPQVEESEPFHVDGVLHRALGICMTVDMIEGRRHGVEVV
jgi:hypothetical protein